MTALDTLTVDQGDDDRGRWRIIGDLRADTYTTWQVRRPDTGWERLHAHRDLQDDVHVLARPTPLDQLTMTGTTLADMVAVINDPAMLAQRSQSLADRALGWRHTNADWAAGTVRFAVAEHLAGLTGHDELRRALALAAVVTLRTGDFDRLRAHAHAHAHAHAGGRA